MIVVIRLIHGLITVFFLSCIVFLYYGGITGHVNIWSVYAIVAIVVEGAVVMINGGNCPLGAIHHRVGDDKTFFELFLPKTAAKRAVPVLGVVAAIGSVLVMIRFWWG